MGDYESTAADHEVQHHLAAAARHILMALKACGNLTDDTKKILSDLNSLILDEGNGGGLLLNMEEQIKHFEEVITRRESNHGVEDSSEYLNAVIGVEKIVRAIGSLPEQSNGKKQRELLIRSNSILQAAMCRLEEELTRILVQHKQCYEPEYMSFRSSRMEDVAYDESFISAEDEPTVGPTSPGEDPYSGQCPVNLIQPEVISIVRSIAGVMFASGYDKEFCRAFVSVRREALGEYLAILNIEPFAFEDILKMDSKESSCEIKKWVWALNIIIRVYLRSERWLCNQIFGGIGQESFSSCFVETVNSAMWLFLNFGEAIAMGPHQPERLFRALDMYEVLSDLVTDIDALFLEDSGTFIRFEFHNLLARLGGYAKRAFSEFRHCIVSDWPRKPFSSGVHPFTNYAMNYIKTLTVYGETLDLLLLDEEVDGLDPSNEQQSGEESSLSSSCPLARHARLLASLLEANLERRSKLLKEEAMEHVFLMNNIHYMVQKIKDSDLRQYFGDEWIKKQIGNFHRHATDYIRATWSLSLPLLKDSSARCELNPFYRSCARDKCRKFVTAFEEVYKSQTGWIIPDQSLREDLQISTSQKVIQAYRSFLGKNSEHIGEKHIKYSADDLENFVLDFFEGSSRSLRSSSRRI